MFKVIDKNTVSVTGIDGKKYIFTQNLNPPHSRYTEAMLLDIQTQQGINFDSQKVLLDKIHHLATTEHADRGKVLYEIARTVDTFRAKIDLAENTITNRLLLASVFWLLEGEPAATLDPIWQTKKVELMKSSQQALSLFLQSLEQSDQDKNTTLKDTLIALHTLQKVLEMNKTTTNTQQQ